MDGILARGSVAESAYRVRGLAVDELQQTTAAMRATWRAEQRALEDDAVYDAWTRRAVIDVFHECLRRGDEVRVSVGPRVLCGWLVDAGADFATVETRPQGQRVSVRLVGGDGGGPPVVVELLAVATGGGGESSTPDATFRSVAQECAVCCRRDPRALVEAGVWGWQDPVVASVKALGVDHLYLAPKGPELIVSLSQLAYLAWARPPRR